MPLPLNQVPDTMQWAAMPTFPNGSFYAGALTLIFRVRRKTDMQIVKEHRLIHMPARIQTTTETRTALYYTKGGPVADTPRKTGVGMMLFTITGHTGYWGIRNDRPTPGPPRAAAIPDPNFPVQGPEVPVGTHGPVATSLIDGAAAIKDLQDTILAYFFPQGQPETQGVTQTQDLQLEFLNLTAPTSARDTTGRVGWIIHPHRNLVDIQQEAPKPFLYTYTLHFATLGPLEQDIPDRWHQDYVDPRTGLQTPQELLALAATSTVPLTGFRGNLLSVVRVRPLSGFVTGLQAATAFIREQTRQLNEIRHAFMQLVRQNFTEPVNAFLGSVTELQQAQRDFVSGVASTIKVPLYAQQEVLQVGASVLDLPRHSVQTLAQAAQELSGILSVATAPQSLGKLGGGQTIISGINDRLTLALNNELPRTLTLPSAASGADIARYLQESMRSMAPDHAANASAYRDFTATFDGSRYILTSGTKGSDAGSVKVLGPDEAALNPRDASATLGLGVANGGYEQQGSGDANTALALLRGVEEACRHLQAFPEYFADQLEAQDAALAARLPTGKTRTQIRGDQHLEHIRVTPGDTLQAIGARVGVPWETLALVNRLTYPYIVEEPTTLVRGRVSSATLWTLSDSVQHWPVDAYAGQRVDIVAGAGGGQSRRILRNTASQLVLEQAWAVPPNDTSDYAIRSAINPIVRAGIVTGATTTSVTDVSVDLIPDAQRGLTLLLTSGPSAGERRQIVGNTATTYRLDTPWDVVPATSSLYVLLGAGPATRRLLLVGEQIGIPRPSAQRRTPIRGRLQDVSAITGQPRSLEERLFGRDAFLDGRTQALVFDPQRQDMRTIAELPNLRQAIIHYINLPLGDLEYAPAIGSYVAEELGSYTTLPLQIQLLASVDRTVKQDTRIASVDGANLATQGGRSVITFGVTAINGSSLDRVVIR